MSREVEEDRLTRIPILGYIFRKIKEHREAIETALNTGKETKGKIKKRYFLIGLIRIISGIRFKILRLRNHRNPSNSGASSRVKRISRMPKNKTHYR